MTGPSFSRATSISAPKTPARTGDFDERRVREAGCVDYITKPYRIEHLRERLAPYLG